MHRPRVDLRIFFRIFPATVKEVSVMIYQLSLPDKTGGRTVSESPQSITDEVFLSLKHPLQRRRFILALFFALILFPLIAAGLVAGTVVLIVPLIALLL